MPRALPDKATVTVLPAARGVPEPPLELKIHGQQLWARAWGEGISWLSPESDWDAVVNACKMQDAVEVARELWETTRDIKYGRLYQQMYNELRSALSELAFNPTARTRLGVAEVQAVSTLERLRRANR
jgi:hypothetical protein